MEFGTRGWIEVSRSHGTTVGLHNNKIRNVAHELISIGFRKPAIAVQAILDDAVSTSHRYGAMKTNPVALNKKTDHPSEW